MTDLLLQLTCQLAKLRGLGLPPCKLSLWRALSNPIILSAGVLLDLRAHTLRARGVEGLVLLELIGFETADDLIRLHLVAFLDVEPPDAPGNLRADDDVVRRDDAGQHEGDRSIGAVPVVPAAADQQEQNEWAYDASHRVGIFATV